ncbi:hypothetical protein SEVIR_9G130350v4 [Setaria viridis]
MAGSRSGRPAASSIRSSCSGWAGGGPGQRLRPRAGHASFGTGRSGRLTSPALGAAWASILHSSTCGPGLQPPGCATAKGRSLEHRDESLWPPGLARSGAGQPRVPKRLLAGAGKICCIVRLVWLSGLVHGGHPRMQEHDEGRYSCGVEPSARRLSLCLPGIVSDKDRSGKLSVSPGS